MRAHLKSKTKLLIPETAIRIVHFSTHINEFILPSNERSTKQNIFEGSDYKNITAPFVGEDEKQQYYKINITRCFYWLLQSLVFILRNFRIFEKKKKKDLHNDFKLIIGTRLTLPHFCFLPHFLTYAILNCIY